MKSEKTLYWLESQNRNMYEIHSSFDTGLCNRINHWSVAQLLNKYNNYEYTIYLQPQYWPELNELIRLPKTKFYFDKLLDGNSNSMKLLDNSYEITDDYLDELISSDLKLTKNNLYSNFKYDSIRKLEHFLDDIGEVIPTIKLKDKELEYQIKTLVSDMVGIHMRRGRGIIYKNELSNLSDEMRESYKKYRVRADGYATDDYFNLEFIKDDVYFNVIDSILKLNPNQKFYISHDLPDNVFKYYKNKYPNNIYTKESFYKFINGRYRTKKIILNTVIDLFSLSNTKYILGHPMSTWSAFAFQYKKDTPFCMVNDDIELILDNYNTISKKLSHS